MKKRKRMFPDKPLGEPVKRYEDTFSAQSVILEAFFPEWPQTFTDEPAILPADASGELEIKTSYERVRGL